MFPPHPLTLTHITCSITWPALLSRYKNPRGSLTRTLERPCHAGLISIRVHRSVVHVTSDPTDPNQRPRISATCTTFNAPNPSINICLHTPLIRLLFCWVVKSAVLILTYAANLRHFSLNCAMSLLDQLWDDTVAGPRPESGLGKLRKQSTFSARSNSAKGTPLLLSYAGGPVDK